MRRQWLAISLQLWVLVVCLFLVNTHNVVNAQDAISPLFVYMIEREISFGYGYTYDMYVMNVDTEEIVFSVETSDDNCGGLFSPDRHWLLYSDSSPRDFRQFDMKLVNLVSGEIISLGEARSTIWSPDSREIAFTRFMDNEQNIYLLDIQSGEEHFIETLDTTATILIQFVDGQLIYAYEAEEGTVAINGSIDATYVVNEDRLAFLSFSPDARWLTYIQRIDDVHSQVFALETNTGRVQAVGDAMDGVTPIWSPDGRWLAYTTGTDLYIWEVASDTIHQITDTDYHESTVVWSPDSQKIAYSEELPGGTDVPRRRVYTYDMQTGEIEWLEFQLNYLADELEWLNNTQLVYSYGYSSSPLQETNSDIYFIDLTTRERTKLTNSPDEEYLECFVG